MEPSARIPKHTARRVRRPLVLTRLGMLAERVTRSFWPFWTVCFLALGLLFLGVHDSMPVELVWIAFLAIAAGLIGSLWYAARKFKWPTLDDAVLRLDATMPGQPISALSDTQAVGARDPASQQVWKAHQRRMAVRLANEARAVEPDLRLSKTDKYGLRYIALTIFVTALLFGSIVRLDSLTEMAPGANDIVATGPSWEGWVEPPAYTGRPSLYLNDIPPGPLEIPAGSAISLRLYGEIGALTVAETVSGRTTDVESAAEPAHNFTVAQAGTLSIDGPGGAQWDLALTPDLPPEIEPQGEPGREANGEMSQVFWARDDYGVVSGKAVFELDLERVDRRHGLSSDPDPREPLVVDLPLPFTGTREEFTETLIENFSEHPWSGLPVTLTMTVEDDTGATGLSEPMIYESLPGRRFFDPLAQAIVEQRRDLLWTRDNTGRVSDVLRAVSHQPDGIFRSETDYLRLRFIVRRLETGLQYGLTDKLLDESAEALWSLALRIEEGDLSNAMERLRRAQERLSEAMENGATDEEIAELMRELREAMQDYMQQLAQQQQQQSDQNQDMANAQEITGDQLQDMLDRLQELMEQGRMDEAQQLLDQLAQMMQNMQMAQQGQQGQGGEGQQAMRGLQETLRNQQELSDESFQGLQDQFGQGQQEGQQPGQGQQQGQGQQPGQGQGQGQQFGQGQGQGQGQAARIRGSNRVKDKASRTCLRTGKKL